MSQPDPGGLDSGSGAVPQGSPTHLVLIPSFDPGPRVYEVVADARRHWSPVWVVVDGSRDGTGEGLEALADQDPGLRVLRLPENRGKGAAVLQGLEMAVRAGFTHCLTMDSDGQHPADEIPRFMAESAAHPDSMILGLPVFAADAPSLRVQGRRISNWWANLETLWAGIGDSLFGFRVYPIEPLRRVMVRQPWMRRFDFDPEAVVRLCWRGVRPINLPAPVRYLKPEEGGVSHFRYGRDNLLLTWMHARLLLGFLARSPVLVLRRLRGRDRGRGA
ncbi:MAG: glycosyltransferase family 2 protein [Bdellovibrio bacteriovorus]